MSRLSIRARLTLVVAGTLAVALTAVGAYVYARVSTQLDAPIRSELGEHAAAVSRALDHGGPRPGRGPAGTQLLAADGRVLNRAIETPAQPLLSRAQVTRALRRGGLAPFSAGDRQLRAVARRTRAGAPVVIVASESLAQREHALERLATELILGGLAGLLAVTAAAWLISRRAFEPFEAMRRQAAAISAAEPGGRLVVPGGDDELARLAETLNDMLDRLERALAYERRFVAEASHELRTPLAVLRAELELARSRPRSREELAAALDSVAEETDRLTRLAEDLLLLARSDSAPPTPAGQAETVDAGELLGAVADRFASRAAEERRAITVDATGALAVSGDRSALERALTNLVDNAMAHGAGTIALSARQHGGLVELHVADEGEGIPADFAPIAFERFSRAGADRSPDGAGLGLAIVRAVAVAHGGTAAAEGADVWLALPPAAPGGRQDEPAASGRSAAPRPTAR